jgi:hypothetical protein
MGIFWSSLISLLLPYRKKSTWNIQASECAQNTVNVIRLTVESQASTQQKQIVESNVSRTPIDLCSGM